MFIKILAGVGFLTITALLLKSLAFIFLQLKKIWKTKFSRAAKQEIRQREKQKELAEIINPFCSQECSDENLELNHSAGNALIVLLAELEKIQPCLRRESFSFSDLFTNEIRHFREMSYIWFLLRDGEYMIACREVLSMLSCYETDSIFDAHNLYALKYTLADGLRSGDCAVLEEK